MTQKTEPSCIDADRYKTKLKRYKEYKRIERIFFCLSYLHRYISFVSIDIFLLLGVSEIRDLPRSVSSTIAKENESF